MANLVPLDASAFTATYDAKKKVLKLSADGTVAGFWIGPFLQRENWMGGLKFSLVSYAGGLGQREDKVIHVSIEEEVTLPRPHFNSRTVLVETEEGTWSVKIDYGNDGLAEPSLPVPESDS